MNNADVVGDTPEKGAPGDPKSNPASTAGVPRHRTAIARSSLSRPIALALGDGLISTEHDVFDYGCGRGGDVRALRALGIAAGGWDPAHAPHEPRRRAQVVNLGYVINVVEEPRERRQVLLDAWTLADRVMIVSARPAWEARGLAGRPYGDGWQTVTGTFQKFYAQEELRAWIDSTLSTQSVAAGPGIFYAFRSPADAQRFRSRQVRRATQVPKLRVSEALFEAHRPALEALAGFLDLRGRTPASAELEESPQLLDAFGSIDAAIRVLGRFTETGRWDLARARASDDLLVYLALSAFGGRTRWSDLPNELQLDVRAFFGSYKRATDSADQLLFALRHAEALNDAIATMPCGKITNEAIYFHTSALEEMPPLIRIYEGCARVLTGSVESANIVKLQRVNRRVAYMSYPRFETEPHPKLECSVRADLRSFDIRLTEFGAAENPPVLHRKELFVLTTHPRSGLFSRLSRQEERAGLLGRTDIGTARGWHAALHSAGLELRGHRLVKRPDTDARANTGQQLS